MPSPSETATVHAAFQRVAARRGDADFLLVEPVTARAYGIDPGPRSWREVAGEVERLRAAYAAAGYGHGHRVGLLLENRPAFFTHWLALNSLGISIVPIHADMRAAEWIYLIGHSEMCLAVAMTGREAALRAAASEAGVAMETIGPAVPGRIPAARSTARHARQTITRNSECALLYTSGTTGKPKGCRLSNGYFLRAGEWYLGLGGLAALRPDAERIATPLPLSHMNALAFSSMAAMLSGGTLVQLDRFHPATWWKTVRDTGATVVHYLGVMPALLLEAAPSPADRQHAVRFGFGAGVDPRHHAPFEERFGFPLLEAWAMTETGAAACIMAHREPRHVGTRSFGRPEPFVEARIVDEHGQDAIGEAPGELLVRAAGPDPRRDFFLGYLKDDEATEEAWADGWFHTGDVVRRGATGDLRFVDRRKNVIRRSGENISAVEVESVLDTHPAVAQSAVAATPDPTRGDEVLACIVLRSAERLPPLDQVASSIVRHALERLAYFKAPGYVAFVESLPLTSSQKIQRGELRDLAKKMPGSPNCHDVRLLKKRKKRLDEAATGAGALTTRSGTLDTGGGAGSFGASTRAGAFAAGARPPAPDAGPRAGAPAAAVAGAPATGPGGLGSVATRTGPLGGRGAPADPFGAPGLLDGIRLDDRPPAAPRRPPAAEPATAPGASSPASPRRDDAAAPSTGSGAPAATGPRREAAAEAATSTAPGGGEGEAGAPST